MITFTQGNLLDSRAEALVNTVNTVGVMGKGIALMFKEAFSENFKAYQAACKRGDVKVGKMFVTERQQLLGPKWIINFPTKSHWRNPSKIEWIEDGLADLERVIKSHNIKSIALPPLGSGNGGLDWALVRRKIEDAFDDIPDLNVIVYEPTQKYQNVAKREGVENLTPARALIAELVRRYWVLGFECSLLEVQKLAYFAERIVDELNLRNPLRLEFKADKFGPYAFKLTHLLNSLDGSYLHCDKRLTDAGVYDVIYFDEAKKDLVSAYFTTDEARPYRAALEATSNLIEGFQSPLGMELLATVDWLIHKEGFGASVSAIKAGLGSWSAGPMAAERKIKLFDERLIALAIEQLSTAEQAMPKGPRGEKRTADVMDSAVKEMQVMTGEEDTLPPDDGKDPNAKALGAKGGAARAKSMTPERRSEIARKGAEKRWKR
jgi:O-acetyl-ADP-ribose deacetylase (regulator of RNase III)